MFDALNYTANSDLLEALLICCHAGVSLLNLVIAYYAVTMSCIVSNLDSCVLRAFLTIGQIITSEALSNAE